jgi:tetratricopeptide (TPR) repeat protein
MMTATRRHPATLLFTVLWFMGQSGGPLLAAPTVADSVLEVIASDDPRMIEAMLPAMQADELPLAEQTLRRYVEENPQAATGHETLGTTLAFLRRFDEATSSLERAVSIDPSRATAWTKLGEIAQSQGRREQALAFYRRAIDADPAEPRAHQLLGLYSESSGDDAAAIRHYEQALAGAPADELGVRMGLARLYARTGSPQRGIELLAPFAQDLSQRPAVHRVIGGAYAETGNFTAAVRHLAATVRLSPGDDAAFEALAGALAAAGDPDLAVHTYRELIESGSRRPAVYAQLGGVLGSLGRWPEAIEVLSAGHALGADTPMDAFHRGVAYEQLGRTADAEAAYREAMALEAAFWPALNNLAVILLKRGELVDGLGLARRAADSAGENGAVLHTLGWAYYLSGRPAEAVAALERSRALMPEVAMVNYTLGRARAAAGQVEEGRRLVMRALELDPQFEFAADARAFLAETS